MPETSTADLEAWSENSVPPRLRCLGNVFNIRAHEVGLDHGYQGLQDDLKAGGEQAEKAFLALIRLKLLVLNLMRAQCKLPFSGKPVSQWDSADLLPAPWGNDFETSDNPKNKQGQRNSTSPRPGWFFRMVEANAEIVCKQFEFWQPEGKVDEARIEQLEKTAARAKGKEIWAAIVAIPDEQLVPGKKGKRKSAA